jgi:small-conductance mechanosensitive channel
LYRRDQNTDPRLYAAAHRLIAGNGLSAALLVMGLNIETLLTSMLRKAHAVILEATSGTAGVLCDPAPSVTLDKFESLFVHATVRYWINWQTTDLFATTTALSQAIVEAAQREGIALFLQPQKVVGAVTAD